MQPWYPTLPCAKTMQGAVDSTATLISLAASLTDGALVSGVWFGGVYIIHYLRYLRPQYRVMPLS